MKRGLRRRAADDGEACTHSDTRTGKNLYCKEISQFCLLRSEGAVHNTRHDTATPRVRLPGYSYTRLSIDVYNIVISYFQRFRRRDGIVVRFVSSADLGY